MFKILKYDVSFTLCATLTFCLLTPYFCQGTELPQAIQEAQAFNKKNLPKRLTEAKNQNVTLTPEIVPFLQQVLIPLFGKELFAKKIGEKGLSRKWTYQAKTLTMIDFTRCPETGKLVLLDPLKIIWAYPSTRKFDLTLGRKPFHLFISQSIVWDRDTITSSVDIFRQWIKGKPELEEKLETTLNQEGIFDYLPWIGQKAPQPFVTTPSNETHLMSVLTDEDLSHGAQNVETIRLGINQWYLHPTLGYVYTQEKPSPPDGKIKYVTPQPKTKDGPSITTSINKTTLTEQKGLLVAALHTNAETKLLAARQQTYYPRDQVAFIYGIMTLALRAHEKPEILSLYQPFFNSCLAPATLDEQTLSKQLKNLTLRAAGKDFLNKIFSEKEQQWLHCFLDKIALSTGEDILRSSVLLTSESYYSYKIKMAKSKPPEELVTLTEQIAALPLDMVIKTRMDLWTYGRNALLKEPRPVESQDLQMKDLFNNEDDFYLAHQLAHQYLSLEALVQLLLSTPLAQALDKYDHITYVSHFTPPPHRLIAEALSFQFTPDSPAAEELLMNTKQYKYTTYLAKAKGLLKAPKELVTIERTTERLKLRSSLDIKVQGKALLLIATDSKDDRYIHEEARRELMRQGAQQVRILYVPTDLPEEAEVDLDRLPQKKSHPVHLDQDSFFEQVKDSADKHKKIPTQRNRRTRFRIQTLRWLSSLKDYSKESLQEYDKTVPHNLRRDFIRLLMAFQPETKKQAYQNALREYIDSLRFEPREKRSESIALKRIQEWRQALQLSDLTNKELTLQPQECHKKLSDSTK